MTILFGVPRVEIDDESGLRINGEREGCLHHGHGLPGSAAIDRAEARRSSC